MWKKSNVLKFLCNHTDLISLIWYIWRRKWQPTPVFLPGEFHRQRSLVGYSPWNCKESDMTEWLISQLFIAFSYDFWLSIFRVYVHQWYLPVTFFLWCLYLVLVLGWLWGWRWGTVTVGNEVTVLLPRIWAASLVDFFWDLSTPDLVLHCSVEWAERVYSCWKTSHWILLPRASLPRLSMCPLCVPVALAGGCLDSGHLSSAQITPQLPWSVSA